MIPMSDHALDTPIASPDPKLPRTVEKMNIGGFLGARRASLTNGQTRLLYIGGKGTFWPCLQKINTLAKIFQCILDYFLQLDCSKNMPVGLHGRKLPGTVEKSER